MLYSKYADPVQLLNGMIKTRRLFEFCNSFIEFRNQETEDKTLWEFYLHRVLDMSFSEYLEQMKSNVEQPVDEAKAINAIIESNILLSSFVPGDPQHITSERG